MGMAHTQITKLKSVKRLQKEALMFLQLTNGALVILEGGRLSSRIDKIFTMISGSWFLRSLKSTRSISRPRHCSLLADRLVA